MCSMCTLISDSYVRMLSECTHVCHLWDQVCQWISDIEHTDYQLSNLRKRVGVLEYTDNFVFNIIILATEKYL